LAHSYQELIDEYGITQDELSKIIHKSRSQIANTLRLLQLGDYALEKLASSHISQGHAKILVGLDEKEQRVVCDTIVGQKLSVRETEQLVAGMKNKNIKPKKRKEAKEPALDLKYYANIIKEKVPFRVTVRNDKVEISFENEEELKDFIRRFTMK
jgi:ParB family chromosome partitioning protein